MSEAQLSWERAQPWCKPKAKTGLLLFHFAPWKGAQVAGQVDQHRCGGLLTAEGLRTKGSSTSMEPEVGRERERARAKGYDCKSAEF